VGPDSGGPPVRVRHENSPGRLREVDQAQSWQDSCEVIGYHGVMHMSLKDTVPSAAGWDLDPAALLALNGEEEQATSPLTAEALEALLRQAFYAGGVDAGREAFLIAFDAHARYDSPNYRWFCERSADFVYIDRVIVASTARGRGLARRLYTELADAARRAGHAQLVCEVNLDPPNPGSDAFHAALGFTVVGQGSPMPGKTVRYWSMPLR